MNKALIPINERLLTCLIYDEMRECGDGQKFALPRYNALNFSKSWCSKQNSTYKQTELVLFAPLFQLCSFDLRVVFYGNFSLIFTTRATRFISDFFAIGSTRNLPLQDTRRIVRRRLKAKPSNGVDGSALIIIALLPDANHVSNVFLLRTIFASQFSKFRAYLQTKLNKMRREK